MDLSQWHIARSISQNEFVVLMRVNAPFEKIKELKGKQTKIGLYMTLAALFAGVSSFPLFNYTHRSLLADANTDVSNAIFFSWWIICSSAILLAFLGGWFIGRRRHYKEIGVETWLIAQIYSDDPVEFLAALDHLETFEPGTVRLVAGSFIQRRFKNYRADKEKNTTLQPAS